MRLEGSWASTRCKLRLLLPLLFVPMDRSGDENAFDSDSDAIYDDTAPLYSSDENEDCHEIDCISSSSVVGCSDGQRKIPIDTAEFCEEDDFAYESDECSGNFIFCLFIRSLFFVPKEDELLEPVSTTNVIPGRRLRNLRQ